MGREHAGKGKQLLLYLAAGMMLSVLLPGCMQNFSSWQGREKLRKSDLLIQAGDFQFALAQYMEVYRDYHDLLGDQALFQIGLLYAHPQNPDANHPEAIRTFQKIAEEFPRSNIRNEAEVCAHILRTVAELKDNLDSLETTYGQSRETLSQLEQEMGEKKKKIARYHKTASSRQAAIEDLKAQLLDLHRRLEQLEGQLSDLKKIDLMMEERRRSLP